MSSYSSLTEKEDFRNAVLASLISGSPGIAGIALYASDKSAVQWAYNLKKPKWADWDPKVYMALDIATTFPIGCASYLVYKHGGGFDYKDTTCTLAVHGANLGCMLYSIYAVKKRDVNALFNSGVGLTVTAGAMVGLFHNIYPQAGHMVLPYALWTALCTYVLYESKKNPLNKI